MQLWGGGREGEGEGEREREQRGIVYLGYKSGIYKYGERERGAKGYDGIMYFSNESEIYKYGERERERERGREGERQAKGESRKLPWCKMNDN